MFAPNSPRDSRLESLLDGEGLLHENPIGRLQSIAGGVRVDGIEFFGHFRDAGGRVDAQSGGQLGLGGSAGAEVRHGQGRVRRVRGDGDVLSRILCGGDCVVEVRGERGKVLVSADGLEECHHRDGQNECGEEPHVSFHCGSAMKKISKKNKILQKDGKI